jgi:hypothetical protein
MTRKSKIFLAKGVSAWAIEDFCDFVMKQLGALKTVVFYHRSRNHENN